MEWKPIGTAPKDGRLVVCYQGCRPNGARVKANQVAFVARFEAGLGWITTPGDIERTPTHWLPLPEPLHPDLAEEKKDG